MKIINIDGVTPVANSIDEQVFEMGRTRHIGLAVAVVRGKSEVHKHPFEEVYYIVRGEGTIHIGRSSAPVRAGSYVSIPKDTYHYLDTGPVEKGELELVVVTSPPYDQKKVEKK